MFERIKPCKSCPFRTSEHALRLLGEERAQEIVDCLLDGKTFTCHDDLPLPEMKRNHCVGAMLILEGLNQPNQMMRIAGRCGMYDPAKLVGHEEVFDDFGNWVEVQSQE